MANCTARNACGACLAFFTLLCLVFAMGFPWYFYQLDLQKSGGNSDGEVTCGLTVLVGWRKQYCYVEGCDSLITSPIKTIFKDYCDQYPEWRDAPGSCDDLEKVNDGAAAMTGIAMFLSFFAVLALLFNCFCTSYGSNVTRGVAAVSTLFAIICLAGAVTYYAVAIQDAHSDCKDSASICSIAESLFQTNSFCNSFMGSNDSATFAGRKVVFAWGPAAWFIPVVLFPFMLLFFCLNLKADHKKNYAYIPS